MKISVAMCTYNGADFLPAQLESIVTQSRKPNEIVICDDGSTDETRALLERFAAQSVIPVSLHFNEKNLGSIKNFEKAIGLCKGDIVALSDQDDVWRRDKLESIEKAFNKSSAGLFFSDAELVDEKLQPLNRRMWNEIGFDEQKRKLLRNGRALDVLITGWTVTGATMAFRSRFANICLPIPEGIAMIHDGWIALAIGAVADVVVSNEPLIQYRQHDRQQVGAPARVEAATQPRGFDKLETAFKRQNSNADLYKILETLEQRLVAFTGYYDTRKALSFVGDYSFHLNVRANLPQRNRLSRVPSILRELLSLRYHEYANGFKSAAKDLVS
ncbi:MAG TPA: glycosyltransferase family 2 protein [Pyrinomonadaceae bacterium]|nr:glycosyltransferase family 2 protein [Pyrinomonadaceae bacterium]